jgi:hypothetical protein
LSLGRRRAILCCDGSPGAKHFPLPSTPPEKAMSRRKWIILGVSVLAIALAAELAYRLWSSARGCVQIINQGDRSMEDLVVRYGPTRIKVGRLESGASTHVWFTPGRPGTLFLEFSQKGNPLKGFPIDGFDPKDNRHNGLKLVLAVKNDRVERFVDDDESTSELGSLLDRVKEWLSPEDRSPP